MVPIVVLL